MRNANENIPRRGPCKQKGSVLWAKLGRHNSRRRKTVGAERERIGARSHFVSRRQSGRRWSGMALTRTSETNKELLKNENGTCNGRSRADMVPIPHTTHTPHTHSLPQTPPRFPELLSLKFHTLIPSSSKPCQPVRIAAIDSLEKPFSPVPNQKSRASPRLEAATSVHELI
jgi:hypothetical protein